MQFLSKWVLPAPLIQAVLGAHHFEAVIFMNIIVVELSLSFLCLFFDHSHHFRKRNDAPKEQRIDNKLTIINFMFPSRLNTIKRSGKEQQRNCGSRMRKSTLSEFFEVIYSTVGHTREKHKKADTRDTLMKDSRSPHTLQIAGIIVDMKGVYSYI